MTIPQLILKHEYMKMVRFDVFVAIFGLEPHDRSLVGLCNQDNQEWKFRRYPPPRRKIKLAPKHLHGEAVSSYKYDDCPALRQNLWFDSNISSGGFYE